MNHHNEGIVQESQASRRFRFRFFWQLIVAFFLVILLAGGGVFLAGRAALARVQTITSSSLSSTTGIWADRLASHYAEHHSWAGIDAFIHAYPCGDNWGPWDQSWQLHYVLASNDGAIIAASDPARIDTSLRPIESAAAVAVTADGEQAGLILVYPFDFQPPEYPFLSSSALHSFFFAALAISGGSLVIGTVLSRGMSRPLADLTEATRAVAAGDLTVRVQARYPAEAGELAAAFNSMAAELARADELRRNLTADVAHELRTPLSVIRGKLEAMLDGVYPATPDHLEPVLEQIAVLTRLVEDLRLLAQVEAGHLVLDKRAIDMGDLLRDAQVNFTPQASDRGVTLSLELPTELPRVEADERRVAQVLGNLLTNALRHTPQGGQVRLAAKEITTTLPTGEVIMLQVTVSDTGTGVPPEDIPYIFERFWRRDKSRSREGGGTGLGLAIAKQLVELHAGTIAVGGAPGRGSTFTFTLPLA
jgi:signal transduction histidine kinase